MVRTLIEANVVISFLHRRSPAQQERAARLFQDAAGGRITLLLHQHVLAETVYVLMNVYDRSPEKVSDITGDLVNMPGIQRIDGLEDTRLLDLWPERITDFGDAVLGSVAREENCPVATFDRTFANALEDLGVRLHTWKDPEQDGSDPGGNDEKASSE